MWTLALLFVLSSSLAPAQVSLREQLQPAEQAFKEGRYDEAFIRLGAARAAAAEDLEAGRRLEYEAAMFYSYLGDFATAAMILDRYLVRAERKGDPNLVAPMANTLCWAVFAQGDLDGALAANERVRAVVDKPGVDPETRIAWLHHYWWDKAYLLREQADRSDSRKKLAAAEEARREYMVLARESEDTFGIAAIDAFFAGRDGDSKRAAAVARSVDWADRADVQDLYIWSVAVETYDPVAARALRTRVAEGGYLMVPVYVRAMAEDAIAMAQRAPREQARERLLEIRGYVKADQALAHRLDALLARLSN